MFISTLPTVNHGFYSHGFYGHQCFYGRFFGSENTNNTPDHALYGQITVFIATFSALWECHKNRDRMYSESFKVAREKIDFKRFFFGTFCIICVYFVYNLNSLLVFCRFQINKYEAGTFSEINLEIPNITYCTYIQHITLKDC